MNRELHVLAAFVHGALATLHTLGILYNLRRGNRWQTVVHAAGVVFSADAARHHVRTVRKITAVVADVECAVAGGWGPSSSLAPSPSKR